ncbi:MAG: leucine-rich repeat domain-containing protein [Eubacteriales bacterium]
MKSKLVKAFSACFALVATLTVSAAVCALPVSAATDGGPYTDGGYYIYTVSDDKATIIQCDPSVEGEIIVPDTIKDHDVVAIGPHAFKDCIGIESVVLPETVKSIGGSAFAGCTSLECITLPSGLENIGGSAFKSCTSLEYIAIPDSVKTIGDSAFEDCIALKEITIPEGVTSVGKWAFNSCSALEEVTVRGKDTRIGEYAFFECNKSLTVNCLNNSKAHKYALDSMIKYQLVIFNENDGSFSSDTSADKLKQEKDEQETSASQSGNSGCSSTITIGAFTVISAASLGTIALLRKKED